MKAILMLLALTVSLISFAAPDDVLVTLDSNATPVTTTSTGFDGFRLYGSCDVANQVASNLLGTLPASGAGTIQVLLDSEALYEVCYRAFNAISEDSFTVADRLSFIMPLEGTTTWVCSPTATLPDGATPAQVACTRI